MPFEGSGETVAKVDGIERSGNEIIVISITTKIRQVDPIADARTGCNFIIGHIYYSDSYTQSALSQAMCGRQGQVGLGQLEIHMPFQTFE
jgi:hypothetical protein